MPAPQEGKPEADSHPRGFVGDMDSAFDPKASAVAAAKAQARLVGFVGTLQGLASG